MDHGHRPGATLIARLLVSVFGLLFVLGYTPLGVALSMDSLNYLLAARSLFDGHGLALPGDRITGPVREVMTTWPPLYSLLLAPVYALHHGDGIAIEGLIRYVNAALLIASLLMLQVILSRSLRFNPYLAALCVICFALLIPVQVIFLYAWSETLFLPLLLALLYLLLAYHRHAAGTLGLTRLVVIGLVTASLVYTRYMGVVFIALVPMALLLLADGGAWLRVRRAIVSGAVGAAALIPLFAFNLLATGHLSGADRGRPPFRLGSDIGLLGDVLVRSLVAIPVPALLAGLAAMALLVGVVAARRGVRPLSPGLALFAVCSLWLVGYLTALVVFRSLQHIDLDTRMISLAVPFVFLIIAAAAGEVFQATRHTAAKVAMGALVLLIVAPTVVSSVGTYSTIRAAWKDHRVPGQISGIRYNSITNVGLEPLRVIQQRLSRDADGVVVTDIPRPQIVRYFFPGARVLRLPEGPFEPVERQFLAHEDGMLVLTSPESLAVIGQAFGQEAVSERMLMEVRHRSSWWVVRMPLAEKF